MHILQQLKYHLMQMRIRSTRALHGKGAILKTTVHGYKASLSLDEHIQREIAAGVYEPEESQWVSDYLEPGMTFFDVGANVGYFAMLAASRVGALGKVVCFEPSPYCCQKIASTIAENGIEQMVLAQTALGDKEETRNLVLEHEGLHSPTFLADHGDCTYKVPVTTLDRHLEAQPYPVIDLLKVDVEGFEPNVIRGAARTLADGKVNAIFCELNETWLARNASSCDQLDRLIQSFGFVPAKSVIHEIYRNVFYTRGG